MPAATNTTDQNGIPSNLPGSVPPGYTPAYGGAPLIPDPIASMWQAIGGDTAGFPSLSSLASMYNLANYNTQASEVAGTPGFDSVLSSLYGQVPRDVINQLSQNAAERGISTGQEFGDSPNSNAAYLRALGLNSEQLQQEGQSEYGSLLGHFPMAAPFNMQAFMTSPEDQQAANAAANVSAASPNPQAAAQAEQAALLAAIAAGKGSVPGVNPGSIPGVTLPTATGASGSGPSGTMVGGALNTGGSTNPNIWSPMSPRPTYPSSVPGRPSDATQTGTQSPLDQLVQSLSGKGPTYGMPYPGGGVMASDTAGSDWWNRSDPWGGLSSIDWGAPTMGGNGQIASDSSGSDWWNAPDPYDALSNIDWGMPTGTQGSTGPGSDWWNAPDPMAALTQIDWGQPSQQEQVPTGYDTGYDFGFDSGGDNYF